MPFALATDPNQDSGMSAFGRPFRELEVRLVARTETTLADGMPRGIRPSPKSKLD
jgi:hypothetical protein